MKKTLLILCALLLTSIGASAQVTDVTEKYIQNPSFEASDTTKLTADETHGYQREEDGAYTGAYSISAADLLETGWTLTNVPSVHDIMTADAKATDDNFGVPGAPSDGVQMLYLRSSWSATTSSVTQKVTLPAGTYKVTVDSKCVTSSSSTAALVVGEESKALTIHSTSNGTNETASNPFLDAWDTAELTFSLEEETELSLGVSVTFVNGSGLSVLLDNFKLYSIDYEYNITELLTNPSFENVDVTELDVDGTRCDPAVGGAWTVTSLEGWDLVAPDNQWSIHDIMTADATATDNDFGAPGTPSNGTYMLYLRDGNMTVDASVEQSIVLPAGEYKLTVDTKCVTTSNSTGALVAKAGDETIESTAVVLHTSYVVDDESLGWDTATIEFTLEEITDVTLGVDISFNGNGSFLLDNFQLWAAEDVQAIDFDYDVTWELANPSFEVDKVANLTEDATRSTSEGGDYTGGAYEIENGLTGWSIGGSNAVSDLMTEACQRTDNNFGAPGTPADGTQMLYLRNNASTTGSVEQTITLPAGDYMLTVNSKCVSTGSSTAKLVAGEKSTALTIHTVSSIPSAWDTASLVLSLDAETEVTVGVDISYSGNGSFLLDNFKLYSVAEIEETISWEMTEAGWGTMILPFAATLEDGLTAYSCNGTEESEDEEGNEMTVVSLTEVGQSITANTPYVIKCTDDSAIKTHEFSGTPTNTVETYTDGIITGTLVDLAIDKGAALTIDGTNYVLQNHTEGDEPEGLAFYPITSESTGVTLSAYHCYLTLDNSTSPDGVRAFISLPGSDNEETGIVAVESKNLANDAIYDLSGRKVSKAVKGVYIQNGKKVLVK